VGELLVVVFLVEHFQVQLQPLVEEAVLGAEGVRLDGLRLEDRVIGGEEETCACRPPAGGAMARDVPNILPTIVSGPSSRMARAITCGRDAVWCDHVAATDFSRARRCISMSATMDRSVNSGFQLQSRRASASFKERGQVLAIDCRKSGA
jgi:hypothetical protein